MVLSGAIQAPHYREQKAADHESSHDYGRVDVVETKHLLSDRQTKRPTVQITVGRQENPAHCLGQEAMRAGTISRRCARRQYDRTRCRFTSYLANLVRPIGLTRARIGHFGKDAGLRRPAFPMVDDLSTRIIRAGRDLILSRGVCRSRPAWIIWTLRNLPCSWDPLRRASLAVGVARTHHPWR